MCSLSWRDRSRRQGKRERQKQKDASNNAGSNRMFSLFFRRLPLAIFCRLLRKAVSIYSLTYCIKFGKRLCENLDIFEKSQIRTERRCIHLPHASSVEDSPWRARSDDKRIGERANARRQRRNCFCQCVEPPSYHYGVPRDNAFHLCVNSLRRVQSRRPLLRVASRSLITSHRSPITWEVRVTAADAAWGEPSAVGWAEAWE